LLLDAIQDFYLSKRSQLLAERTLEFYERTAGEFVRWLETHGVTEPEGIKAQHVRAYIASVKDRGVSDATVHIHAEGVKALCRFFFREWSTPVFTIDMPKPAQARMRVPSVQEMTALLGACTSPRDKAVLLVLADTGVRLSECADLLWDDVNFDSGTVLVRRGKGRKARTVVIGTLTRRTLVRYRKAVPHGEGDPLWVGQVGPLGREGIRHVLRRLSRETGIRFSAHDMRRFFATASLRAGMDVVMVKNLLGHTSLTMTMQYLAVISDDLRTAHEQHGPVDRFLR
jgi:site-specific recombinase XerD